MLENYEAWLNRVDWLDNKPGPKEKSSTLFDIVAVYMAYSEDFLKLEDVKSKLTDQGMTLIDVKGHDVRSANHWRDFDGFKKSVVERLTTDHVGN